MYNFEPCVSIVCISYNHINYIRDAIEGFLKQKTSFPIKIVIHDDASSDGTADIIKKYFHKYPALIKPIIQKENQWSKGKRITPIAMQYAKGKYIALCEGDDYWTDPYKLQKQVDFLEANPDYVMCYHDAKIIDESGNVVSESKMPEVGKKDYSSDEIIRGSTNILTLSLLFRNVIKEFPPEMQNVKNGDNFLTSMLGNYGKGKFMPEITPAVYRTHGGGVWSTVDNNNRLLSKITTYFWLHLYYERIGKKSHADYYILRIKRLLEDKVPSPTNKNQHILNSKSYKIGRAITYPYRFIMRMKNFL